MNRKSSYLLCGRVGYPCCPGTTPEKQCRDWKWAACKHGMCVPTSDVDFASSVLPALVLGGATYLFARKHKVMKASLAGLGALFLMGSAV